MCALLFKKEKYFLQKNLKLLNLQEKFYLEPKQNKKSIFTCYITRDRKTKMSSLTLKCSHFTVPVSPKVTLSCKRWFVVRQTQKNKNNNDDDDNDQQEKELDTNKTNQNSSTRCVVFCHQYGKMGGNGNLLVSMAQRLIFQSASAVLEERTRKENNNNNSDDEKNTNNDDYMSEIYQAVTFDMRGVGRSTGSASFTCTDEVQDVTAVCNHLVKNENFSRLFLVGSSAGANIAGSALDTCPEIVACAVIGYTFGWAASILFSSHFAAFQRSVKPKLLIHGTEDGFTSNGQFEDLMKKLSGPCNEKVIIEGVGHFEMEQPNFDQFMVSKIFSFFKKF